MPVRLSIFTRYAIRSLAASRTRTFVTAVGVALACALLASALVLAGSLRAGIVAGEEASEGAWQVGFSQMGEGQLARVEEELGPSLALRRDLGAAPTEDPDVPLLNVVTTLSGKKASSWSPPRGRPLAGGSRGAGRTLVLGRDVANGLDGGALARAVLLDGRPRLPPRLPPSYELDETGETRLAEALYGAVRALPSTFGVAAAAVDVASAFDSSAASVLLRAHDFAVLRSVGMGERDLMRMLARECARTAAWGLALGLSAALALGAWLCAQGGLTVRSLGLEVPWAHVAGAVALVALALLASCAHALRRLRTTPLIDALRAE